MRSEDGTTLGDILLSEDERLATLDDNESTGLACGAFKLECNLLGGLGLLSEDGLGLPTETLLLRCITSFTLSASNNFTLLVL